MGVALLIGGVVITETVFGIPGLGRLTVDAILRRDYPVIQGTLLFIAIKLLLINLLVDLLYAYIDPRVRYERGTR
jgi:peptide/nickel transport system permease protein